MAGSRAPGAYATAMAACDELKDGQVAERPMAPDCKSGELSLRGFESLPAHSCGSSVAEPRPALPTCGCRSTVEHLPSKQVVGSSILLTRSTLGLTDAKSGKDAAVAQR